jgi:predicted nucleotidyltransferase component of viral defense system
VSEAITSDERLDAAEARTGLLRAQLLTMVAKSAAVRHVATSAIGGDQFVLKGGTLLTHVYRSPRQSIADADYLHLDKEVDTDQVEEALAFSEGDFTMAAEMHYEDGRDSFEGKGVFSFEDIRIKRQRDRELKITVSIRPGERLDPPGKELFYYDPTLTEPNFFAVQGLTIDELSAEKLLGWCSKDLAKHLVDLAYVARTLGEEVDHDRVAELVREKFEIEGGAGRYQRIGIRSTSDLPRRFADPERLQMLLHEDWERLSADEIYFLQAEQDEPADRQLLSAANVERIATAFWAPTLASL